jgi:hypothetical protein
MPTTKERLDDHDSRLGQVEVALRLKPPELKKAILKEKYEWVINHKGTSSILAIILCGVSVLGAYWLNHRKEWWNHDVDERIRTVLNEKDGVNETLHRVEQTVNRTETKLETLEPFIHDVIQHQFDSAAKLSPSALQERLPAIQHLAAVAQNQGVKVDAPALDVLGRKLGAVDTKATGFWPAAAELINYRSQIIIHDIQSLMRSDLPNCTDHDPTPMELTIGEEDEKTWKRNDSRDASKLTGDNGTKMVGALYQDCRFTLDSPEETARIPELGQQRSYVITFRHCQIVYRGGQVALLTPHPHPTAITGKSPERTDVYILTGQTVRFENCLFVFALNSQPPSEGQWLTKQLLAQGGSRLTVTSPKPSTHS